MTSLLIRMNHCVGCKQLPVNLWNDDAVQPATQQGSGPLRVAVLRNNPLIPSRLAAVIVMLQMEVVKIRKWFSLFYSLREGFIMELDLEYKSNLCNVETLETLQKIVGLY